MKKLFKKIKENKFQVIFFGVVIAFLVCAVVVSTIQIKPNEVQTNLNIDNENNNLTPPIKEVEQVETFNLPLLDNDYIITRKFYEKNDTKENQEKALIKYGTTFRTSDGTAFALKNNESFDVYSCLKGKVVEVKKHPLYNNYIVIEHDNDIKTYYYGLSDVDVSVGDNVLAKQKLGTSGKTELDKEAGNHVYLKVTKNQEKINPEKIINKKITEI